MGLGGGFFMTIWDAETKKAYYLDARETAPNAADKNMFDGNAHLSMYGEIFSRTKTFPIVIFAHTIILQLL